MSDEPIETGLAGLTAAVTVPTIITKDHPPSPPHICVNATGGARCDICFGPISNVDTQPQLPTVCNIPPPAYTKAPLPDGWNLNKVAGLVRDVAQEMYDLPTILKKHELTDKQYATLEANEFFKRALEQFTLDWNTAANTQKRLALEAAIALEDALPTVAARASKTNEPLADVVSLVKVLAEIAGSIGTKAANQPQGPTEKFKIIINLGADTLLSREASTSPVQIFANSEGSGNPREVQSFDERGGTPTPV